jgi:isochorismate pyruvate lyase
MIKKPEICETMEEVRDGVDAVDAAICQLLGDRFRYMAAAARIKSSRESIRDEKRKAQVIENAKAAARANGVPEPLAAALWEMLIESSIAYEMALFGTRQTPISPAPPPQSA